MRLLVDVYLPAAERIRWVVDNLNTPTPAALYGVFPPDEARRITRQLEFHYTPKQGSWLTIAECELAVLAGQCLDRRMPNLDTLQEVIAAWQCQRNQHPAKIHWQFGTDLARVKLKRLYPPVELSEDPVGPEASEPVKTCALAHYFLTFRPVRSLSWTMPPIIMNWLKTPSQRLKPVKRSCGNGYTAIIRANIERICSNPNCIKSASSCAQHRQ